MNIQYKLTGANASGASSRPALVPCQRYDNPWRIKQPQVDVHDTLYLILRSLWSWNIGFAVIAGLEKSQKPGKIWYWAGGENKLGSCIGFDGRILQASIFLVESPLKIASVELTYPAWILVPIQTEPYGNQLLRRAEFELQERTIFIKETELYWKIVTKGWISNQSGSGERTEQKNKTHTSMQVDGCDPLVSLSFRKERTNEN